MGVGECRGPGVNQRGLAWLGLSSIVAAVLLAGCAGSSAPTNAGHVVHGPKGKSYPSSSNFRATITPTQGPRGTVVTIRATGCFDPSGNEDDVTYNDGNQGGAFANIARVHRVSVTTSGYTYAGRYTIPANATPIGAFIEQCGSNTSQQIFTVTAKAPFRTLLANIVHESRDIGGYRLVLAPATYSDGQYLAIPGRPLVTYLVPSSLVQDPAILVGAVTLTLRNSRVTGLAIMGG